MKVFFLIALLLVAINAQDEEVLELNPDDVIAEEPAIVEIPFEEPAVDEIPFEEPIIEESELEGRMEPSQEPMDEPSLTELVDNDMADIEARTGLDSMKGANKDINKKPLIPTTPVKMLTLRVQVPQPFVYPEEPVAVKPMKAPQAVQVPIPQMGHLASIVPLAKKGMSMVGKVLLLPITLPLAKKSALLAKTLGLAGLGVAKVGAKVALIGGKKAAAGAGFGALSAGLLGHTFGGHLIPIMASPMKWMSQVLPVAAPLLNGQSYALVDSPYLQAYAGLGNEPAEVPLKPNGIKGKNVDGLKAVDEEVDAIQDSPQQLTPEDTIQRQKRSVDTPVLEFERALRLLRSFDISHCIARVVCQLSCDIKSYGQRGRQVFENLLRLQTTKHNDSDLTIYREAVVFGRRYSIGLRNGDELSCSKCSMKYLHCKASTDDLLAVASLIRVE